MRCHLQPPIIAFGPLSCTADMETLCNFKHSFDALKSELQAKRQNTSPNKMNKEYRPIPARHIAFGFKERMPMREGVG